MWRSFTAKVKLKKPNQSRVSFKLCPDGILFWLLLCFCAFCEKLWVVRPQNMDLIRSRGFVETSQTVQVEMNVDEKAAGSRNVFVFSKKRWYFQIKSTFVSSFVDRKRFVDLMVLRGDEPSVRLVLISTNCCFVRCFPVNMDGPCTAISCHHKLL